MRLTGIVGVCSDVAYRPFISGQLLKHRQINQTVNAFGVMSTTCVTSKSMAADSSRYTC